MRSPAVLVAVFVCTARASAQQPGTLHIGSAAARPGEMGSGFIEVPAGVDSGTRVPLTLVRGREPGPTLALLAGTHGDEVAPIIALQRVRRELDPARLRGTVLLVHVANLPSFLRRTVYYSPIDGKNLNRVYPGKRDGTVSERIADAITREIIERADYLVDIHAGDGNESLRPYTYWSPLGLAPRADSVAREMALAWGNDYIVIDTARPRDPRASVYTQNTAHLRGKPALTTEAGYLGIAAEEMVARNVQSVFRLLRYLKMVPGDVELVRHWDLVSPGRAGPCRAERDGDRGGHRLFRRHHGGHHGPVRGRHAIRGRHARDLRGRAARHGRARAGGAMKRVLARVPTPALGGPGCGTGSPRSRGSAPEPRRCPGPRSCGRS